MLVFLGVHALLGWATIRRLSPTFDETIHLAAGYQYLATGDYRLNTLFHPPAAEMWAALPLLAMKPGLPQDVLPYWQDIERLQYSYADLFLYHNRVDPERLLNAGRLMNLALSLLLGLLLSAWSGRMFGAAAGWASLLLWAFFPPFIAHGTLVTTDMAMTLGYAATFSCAWRWWRSAVGGSPAWGDALALGASLGLTLASKYSAVIALPVLGLILAWAVGSRTVGARIAARHAALALAAAAAVLLAVYRFAPLFSYYAPGFAHVASGVTGGRDTFLMGRHSTQGWLSYFPLLLLLKTPLPFLALAVAAAASRRLRTREALAFLALPAAVYFAAACLSRLQIGHRYILPIYPFLIVGASALFARSSDAASRPVPRKVKALAAVLLAWYLVGTVRVHPWHLSYVNEVVGSQDRAYRYFTDSNVDWGQGLKELAGYLRQERIDGVYLCYFGSADPGYYGIRYLPVRFFDGLTPEYAAAVRRGDPSVAALPRTVLAISATNLQATYYPDKQAFSFLRDVTPSAIVAHSILVYDLDRHPAQRRAFRDMLGLPVE